MSVRVRACARVDMRAGGRVCGCACVFVCARLGAVEHGGAEIDNDWKKLFFVASLADRRLGKKAFFPS